MDDQIVDGLRRRSESGADPDFDALLAGASVEAARRRRGRVRAIAAAGCVALVGAVTTGVLVASSSGNDTATVAIAPHQSTSRTIPAGWKLIDLPDKGIQLAVPPDWTQLATTNTSDPTTIVSVASTPTFQGSCSTSVANGGSGVTLYEYRSHKDGDSFADPDGSQSGFPFDSLADRPADFQTITQKQNGTAAVPVAELGCSNAGGVTLRALRVVFRDHGRVFLARVATSDSLASPDFQPGLQILNTLSVTAHDMPETTTTTPEATTSTGDAVPTTTTTPLPSATPQSTDESAISAVFAAWMGGPHTDDHERATVEDGNSILDAVHAGWAQHTPDDLAKYSGRADTIQMIDADHATVQYTLLWNGQPQFGQRTGTAIRTNGTWQVSRDTECQLLTLGGITCPPRT